MEIDKLIPMTGFVIHHCETKTARLSKFYKYANFLRQPLNLEMFIGEESLFEGFEYMRLNNGFMVRNGFFKLYHYDFEGTIVEDLLRYGSPITLTSKAKQIIYGSI